MGSDPYWGSGDVREELVINQTIKKLIVHNSAISPAQYSTQRRNEYEYETKSIGKTCPRPDTTITTTHILVSLLNQNRLNTMDEFVSRLASEARKFLKPTVIITEPTAAQKY